jgi:hypothetical protein
LARRFVDKSEQAGGLAKRLVIVAWIAVEDGDCGEMLHRPERAMDAADG